MCKKNARKAPLIERDSQGAPLLGWGLGQSPGGVNLRFLKKTALFFALLCLLCAIAAPAALASLKTQAVSFDILQAEETPAVIGDEDVITLLALNLGGRDLADAAWLNMNLSEKQTLRDQAARIDKMARGAELEGLTSSPGVARTLRWGVSSFLADSWEKKISSETDLSEEAARSFYEANRQWYMSSGAARYRKAVYPASRKEAAFRARKDLNKAPLNRLKNCVTVDWTEYGSVPQPLGGALCSASVGVVMGPLQTDEGYVLFEILERRGETPLPFEQCIERVREDMVRAAITERLELLGK